MKKKGIILTALILSVGFTMSSFKSSEAKLKTEKVVQTGENYRVTAYTKKDIYGESKWIDLTVNAYVTQYTKIIYNVYYNDGYGLKKVNPTKDWEYKDTYKVYIDGAYYYYKF